MNNSECPLCMLIKLPGTVDGCLAEVAHISTPTLKGRRQGRAQVQAEWVCVHARRVLTAGCTCKKKKIRMIDWYKAGLLYRHCATILA